MTSVFRRAGSAAFFVAAAWVSAAAISLAPIDPAWGDESRHGGEFVTVQADLQKRADALLKGATDAGGKVKYGAVEPGSTNNGLVIKDVEITSPDNKTVKIERIDVRAFDWDNTKEPRHMDLSIKALVISAASLDEEVKELGLSTLTVNADFAYAFDEANKTFEVSGIVIDVAELGELKLKLKLAGIALNDLKGALNGGGEKKNENGSEGENKEGKNANPGEQAQMKLLTQLSIVGASISFRDKSLVERMIRAEAKKKGISESEAKAKMLADLAEQKKEAQDDATREMIDHATKFLTNPGVIEIAANPSAPANVMQAFMALMGNPATMKEILGLTVAVK